MGWDRQLGGKSWEGQAASAEVEVQQQFALMVGSPPPLNNGVGMVGTASAGTVPVAVPILPHWLRLVDGQLVAQPAVAQQVLTAQHPGVLFCATTASMPPPHPAEAAAAAAQLVAAAATHLKAAAAAAPQTAEAVAAAHAVDHDAWPWKNYRVPPHRQLHTRMNATYRLPQSPQEILEFTKSLSGGIWSYLYPRH